ncbi:AAA family ATPase [Pelovirga terrestris]|uniref:Cytidylate kinase-like family protein n=1 Tax=Pelovirga terrestris TaxID=2771352 RepID=A0A8J6UHF1_9BACT|nr:cytidylate kinase-like family protein [Pelovirga terrestris]MBD1401353.1 cytidylate kinase-like family protein [Pelovirga terrestris]
MIKSHVWTPQMEAKLQAWYKQQQLADQSKPAVCITLTREFGCQAYALAEALQKRLNTRTKGEPWVVVGRQVIDEVAKLSGFTAEQIDNSENTPAALKSIFSMFLDRSSAEETEVFAHMRRVMRGFAKRGNCIIVGRGAPYVTQDLPNCIHLRLVAPMDFKIANISSKYGMDQAAARDHIDRLQGQREAFVRRFVNEVSERPAVYHLIMNDARMPTEGLAQLVDDYIQRL